MKKEDQWINNLRKQMEEYSEPLPPNGWDRLEKSLASPRVIPLWRNPRIVAAAAVFVAAVSSLSIWLSETTSGGQGGMLQPEYSYNESMEGVSENVMEGNLLPDKIVADNLTKPIGKPSCKPDLLPVEEFQPQPCKLDESLESEDGGTPDEDSSLPAGTSKEESVENEMWDERNSNMSRVHDRKVMAANRAAMEERTGREKKNGQWSVGIEAGNTPYAASTSFGGFSGMVSRATGMMASSFAVVGDKNSTYRQVLFNNRDGKAKTNIHHKMPVTVGAMVKWRITDQWALESGVTYTYLSSNFRSGSDTSYSEWEQKLHYVGVPLKLHRMLWENRRFSFYASAGGMVEKCISGSEEGLDVAGVVKTKAARTSLDIDALQWSVMAAAGVQLNVTRWLGMYVEPGVAYYFDDGEKIETIRKEHPLNFNLQFGLRYSFGR